MQSVPFLHFRGEIERRQAAVGRHEDDGMIHVFDDGGIVHDGDGRIGISNEAGKVTGREAEAAVGQPHNRGGKERSNAKQGVVSYRFKGTA